MVYALVLFIITAEDEEKEQLAREISKDWNSGNSSSPSLFHTQFDLTSCFENVQYQVPDTF